MTNTTGSTYQMQIGPFDTLGTWQYIIRSFDNEGNRNDIQKSFTVTTCAVDTTPPVATNATASPDPARLNSCTSDTTTTVSVNVTDSGSGVNRVQLFYRHVSHPTWTLAGNMANTSGSTYQIQIGPFDTLGTWQYIIRPFDDSGNQTNVQKSFTVATCSVDTTPPVAIHATASPDPAQLNSCSNNTIATVSVDVTDSDSGVNRVQLFYRHVTHPAWTLAGNMTNTTGSTYQMQIGPFDTLGTWQYIIRPFDNNGNQTNVQKSFTVGPCVVDTEPPIVSSAIASPNPVLLSGCSGDTSVTISADVQDPGSGVSRVQLFYRHVTHPAWTLAGDMVNTSGDRYEKEIGPFDTVGTWQYIIRPFDNSGNQFNVQKSWTVNDCTAGFYTDFGTGQAENWQPQSGSWLVASKQYQTAGYPGALSSTSYVEDFTNFDYQARLLREGCENCANTLIIRGEPLPLTWGNYWANSYMFQYTRIGTYSVWKIVDGSYVPLQYWTTSPAISQGSSWNTMRVTANGSSLKFYMNDTLIWTGSDATLTSGQIGLAMFRDAGSVDDRLAIEWVRLSAAGSSMLQGPATELSSEQRALNAAANELAPTERSDGVGFLALAADRVTAGEAASLHIRDIEESTNLLHLQGEAGDTTLIIRADVIGANAGVSRIELLYRPINTLDWISAGQMTHVAGNQYKLEIGPFDSAGIWQYAIRAEDEDGNSTETQRSFTVGARSEVGESEIGEENWIEIPLPPIDDSWWDGIDIPLPPIDDSWCDGIEIPLPPVDDSWQGGIDIPPPPMDEPWEEEAISIPPPGER